ncbi:hypothetical protein [Deinococcus sp. SL84]|nr:hypothetical protein [Deinococcus sp. SL84]MCY1703908.1 hypothetical protein [Deinococcus sp. SL84]
MKKTSLLLAVSIPLILAGCQTTSKDPAASQPTSLTHVSQAR